MNKLDERGTKNRKKNKNKNTKRTRIRSPLKYGMSEYKSVNEGGATATKKVPHASEASRASC